MVNQVMSFPLSDEQIRDYDEAGYLLLKGLFDSEEIELLRRSAKEDKQLDEHAFGRNDGEGGTVRLSLWNHPGEGIYGAFARCNRMVSVAEQLLRDEPYHYHSKMIMKDAAGRRCLGLASRLWILVSQRSADAEPGQRLHRGRSGHAQNGCLQVIRGSHHCGRIDHQLTGDQAGADPERVQAILEANGARLRRDGSGRRPVFPFQSAASQRPEPFRATALVDDLLLTTLAPTIPTRIHIIPATRRSIGCEDSAIKQIGIKRFADDCFGCGLARSESRRKCEDVCRHTQ